MSAVWFIGFSLVWTGLLAGGAHLLSREPVPARFAHTIWRGAAFLSVVPWIVAGLYALLPDPDATPIPDLPYVSGAADAFGNNAAMQAAAETVSLPIVGWILGGLLLTGWLFRLGMNALCQLRLQRIKTDAVENTSLSAQRWAETLNLQSTPQIATIPNGSPFLAGIQQRTIYLPQTVTSQADADIILAHECTHVARGDLVTRPIERFIADIFWFSPFAWMMRRQLDYWREAACDEQTASLTGDSVAYARALANTARATRPIPFKPLPVAAFILPRQETLKKRLTQLLEHDAQKPRRSMAIMALVAGLLLAPLSLAQTSSLTGSSIFTHAVFVDAKVWVSAPFGDSYDKKADKKWWHAGVDIAAAKFTPVYSPADAKVLMAKKKDEYGYTVDILLEDGRKMRFSQLEKYTVKKGDVIKAGTIIGKVGASGKSKMRPHLHLEVYKDGEHMNPTKVKGLTLFEECCNDNT